MAVLKIVPLIAIFLAIIALINNRLIARERVVFFLGLSLFIRGGLSIDAAAISWPLWAAPTRGVVISLTDCIAWALIATRQQNLNHLPFLGIFSIYCLSILVSIVLSTVPMASFFVLWQMITIILVYIAISGECANRKLLLNLVCGVAVGLLLQGGWVVIQRLQGFSRPSGSMSHPNVLAILIELSIFTVLSLLLSGAKRRILWVGLFAGMIALAAGGSRAGVALTGIGVLLTSVISLIHSSSPRKVTVFSVITLLLLIAAPVTAITLAKRFGDQSVFAEEDQRAALEKSAGSISADHPMGIGANTFVTFANTNGYTTKAGVSWGGGTRAAPVHNTYLLVRAEMGYLGLFSLILLYLYPMLAGLHLAFSKRRFPGSAILIGSSVSLFILTIHSFYEWAPVTYDCQALIALNLGIIGGFKRQISFVLNPRHALGRRGRSLSTRTI